MKDPIVEEVRAAREAYAARLKFNLHAITEDARKHQRISGRRIIRLSKNVRGKTGRSCNH